MIDFLVSYVETGARIVTANARLARTLRRSYDERRKASGGGAWTRLLAVPWSAWVRGLFDDAALGGINCGTVLTGAQELLLWRSIVEESEAGRQLLSPREAARAAASAWSLAAQYRIPVAPALFRSTPDASAFLDWAREFEARCSENGWVPQARVADAVASHIEQGAVEPPARAVLCGFDDVTPQQTALLDACASRGMEWTRSGPEPLEPTITAAAFPDSAAELRAAAQWARECIERRPEARVAVVIPELAHARERVRSIFTQELESGPAPWSARSRPSFHISSGAPLSSHPVAAAALLALELTREVLTVDVAGAILRCPYLRGAAEHASARGKADAEIRASRRRRIRAAALSRHMPDVVEEFRRAWRGIVQEQTYAGWAAAFSALLAAAGWPGDAVLSSAEYQAREAFAAALAEFGACDPSGAILPVDAARERLRELLRDTEFSAEDPGAPVQIMGVLESAGSQFDALWVAGLHDAAWPRPARPHPFIPLSVQVDLDLPHCSADREYRFAETVTARLVSSAPEVVLSWPSREGDAEQRPTPLLPAGVRWYRGEAASRWLDYLRLRAPSETVADHAGPPLAAGSDTAGGTGLLKHQAACPFRCFAQVRLGAKRMEAPDAGLPPLDRGKFIHKALELFWKETATHDRLAASDPAAVAAFARQCVEVAFGTEADGSRLMAMEMERATVLVTEWLEMERNREPFRVIFTEDERRGEVGGLALKGRLDRIDELSDGTRVIIDYKCKAHPARPEGWDGERPDEPQVPFYCATHDAPVSGALFGNINREGATFTGWTARDGVAPGAKPDPDVRARIAAWRQTLEALARDFAAGRAEVDPKPKACDHCGMEALCRIDTRPEAM